MKPNPIALGDIECVDFAVNAAFAPYLAAAHDRLPELNTRSLASEQLAQLVRQIGIAELMPDLQATGEARPLLFQLASTLAHADVGATWAGLADAPLALLGIEPSASVVVALPHGAQSDSGSTAWLPLATAQQPQLYWPDATRRVLHGPRALLASEGGSPLLGLPLARVHQLTALTSEAGVEDQPLAADAWADFINAQLALVLGMIDGACRRAVQEAYSYAKQRYSAGKPIIQHQAVALRLAELALNQQSFTLYAQAVVEGVSPLNSETEPLHLNTAHVADLCFHIGRDAVQIAAAHGYVEGLPFRRLFEQLRTLASLLHSVHSSATDNAALASC